MTSTQKATVFQVFKTNKSGSKVAVSSHRGAEITASTSQRGHGYISSSQRGVAVSPSPPPQRRSEAAAYPTTYHSTSDYPRCLSPQLGPGFSTVSTPQGTESRPRTETPRRHSPHRKNQSVQTTSSYLCGGHRNASPIREESARKTENKPGREVGYHPSLASDAKYRHLSFTNGKEEDPPSKVQNPQGVKVPRRISAYPKDEAVQTEPIRRTTAEVRSSRTLSIPGHGTRVTSDYQTVIRKIPSQEPEPGPHSSNLSEPMTSQKSTKLSSGLKVSVLKDLDGAPRTTSRSERIYIETKPSSKVLITDAEPTVKSPTRDRETARKVTISPGRQSTQSPHRVAARAVSEGVSKSPLYSQPSIHTELELTPRPLPPRSLPRYGPDCSWWALLNPKVEVPQNQSSVFDFEPKSPPPLDTLESFYETDSAPFCEDLMFQREKASLPPSPMDSLYQVPLTEVQKAWKCTSKQPIPGFNAFFLGM